MGSHGPRILARRVHEGARILDDHHVRAMLQQLSHDIVGLENNISMDDIQLWKHYMEIPDYLVLIRCLEPHEIQCAKVDTLIFTV